MWRNRNGPHRLTPVDSNTTRIDIRPPEASDSYVISITSSARLQKDPLPSVHRLTVTSRIVTLNVKLKKIDKRKVFWPTLLTPIPIRLSLGDTLPFVVPLTRLCSELVLLDNGKRLSLAAVLIIPFDAGCHSPTTPPKKTGHHSTPPSTSSSYAPAALLFIRPFDSIRCLTGSVIQLSPMDRSHLHLARRRKVPWML